jgi:hypothetical protein
MNPTILSLNILTETDRTSRILAYRVQNPADHPVLAGLFVFRKRDFTLLALQDLHLQPNEATSGLLSLPLADLDAGDLDIRLLVRSVAAGVAGTFVDVLTVERLSQQGQTVTFQAVPETGTRGVLVAREDAEILGVRAVQDDAAWTGQLRLKRASKRTHVTAYVDAAPSVPVVTPTLAHLWRTASGVTARATQPHTDWEVSTLLPHLLSAQPLRFIDPSESSNSLTYSSPYYGPATNYTSAEGFTAQGTVQLYPSPDFKPWLSRAEEVFMEWELVSERDVIRNRATLQEVPLPTGLLSASDVTAAGLSERWVAAVKRAPDGARTLTVYDRAAQTTKVVALPVTEVTRVPEPVRGFTELLMDDQNGWVVVAEGAPGAGTWHLWTVTLPEDAPATVFPADPGFTGFTAVTPGNHGEIDPGILTVLPGAQVPGADPTLPVVLWAVREYATVGGSQALHLMSSQGTVAGSDVWGRTTIRMADPAWNVVFDETGTAYFGQFNSVYALPYDPYGGWYLEDLTPVATFNADTYGSMTAVALKDGALFMRGTQVLLVNAQGLQHRLEVEVFASLELLLVDHQGRLVVRYEPGIAT